MRVGFDNNKYLETQSLHIRERIAQFGGKLYLEFGGKLFDDHHAARVLPGFAPDSKMKMLTQLKDQVEIVIAINAADIEKNKVRGDLGITYDVDVLRLIDAFRGMGLLVGSVVITRYAAQSAADVFQHRLEDLGIKVYRHYSIEGYPHNIPLIVSDEGYGKNQFIRPRPRQRQDGGVPEPTLPRTPPGGQGGLRQVRDLPHLEPPPQPPGEPGLRGGHRRPQRREYDRPLPPGRLRGDHGELQPGCGGLPRPLRPL